MASQVNLVYDYMARKGKFLDLKEMKKKNI